MSRYIALLGLLAVMGAVYGGDEKIDCKDNEHYYICGKLCEPSCEVPHLNPEWCPAALREREIVCTQLTADCRCNQGYVRDTNSGSCVLPKNCPKN